MVSFPFFFSRTIVVVKVCRPILIRSFFATAAILNSYYKAGRDAYCADAEKDSRFINDERKLPHFSCCCNYDSLEGSVVGLVNENTGLCGFILPCFTPYLGNKTIDKQFTT